MIFYSLNELMKMWGTRLGLLLMGCLCFQASAKDLSIDVFAIPSQPVKELVAHTSQALKSKGMTSFYEKGMPVHVTLYLTEFPEESISKIKQSVQNLVKKTKPFPLVADGITVTKGNWVFIDIQRSQALQRLADQVTMAIEPYRVMNPELPQWVKKYPGKLAAFERYGSPNVFQNFQPHLTLLAAEKSPNLPAFEQLMKKQPPKANGVVTGLGIGITDKWGQQKDVLATYMFR
ncbi:2'-5' RNA ligase family protein [Vibrio salinus]|uniref:2'-5' RNA ligase family protein n=1 Tax=Vibrio salinus TaxID=2899784 RepID=UPI001E46FBA4|nr:2'-5' RNA ligase family protein [Vibrio salinus]MCE0494809.1 2'-5' RNA ligase family protein [Vibrio salinus]